MLDDDKTERLLPSPPLLLQKSQALVAQQAAIPLGGVEDNESGHSSSSSNRDVGERLLVENN